jgi:hypothetical protein
MIPAPTVAGLHVCHGVDIDLSRHEFTLTRSFHELSSPIHPNYGNGFWTIAELYGPIGKGTLTLTLMTLDQQRMVYGFKHSIEFKNRFSPVYFRLNIRNCRFPKVGEFEIMLWVDLDIVAQRRFVVVEGIQE